MLPIRHQAILENREQILSMRRKRRAARIQSDPFDLPEKMFIRLYRLNKTLVRRLMNIIIPHMNQPKIEGGINNSTKVFCALRFYGTGSYQRGIGEETTVNLSQTAVHRAIHEVTETIINVMAEEYISFPTNINERNNIKFSFMESWGFPGIIGAIDCTHVAILKPEGDEFNFINRKGFHSINCQLICDHNLIIRNVNPNYGGSTHDFFIWRNSAIKNYMETLYENQEPSWLIGDSGYPLQPVLMTPFMNPADGSPESRYNYAHVRARNCIERCIGLLKMRFRCILKERSLRYRPQFAAKLVTVSAILHNMCVGGNVPLIHEIDHEIDLPNFGQLDNNIGLLARQNVAEGIAVRNRIVQQYFQ